MTYTIAGGEVFNMVLTHPDRTHPSTWEQRDAMAELKQTYVGWDES
jgi:salicylate hydroxylase